ncbi:cathepsin R-like isoform X2 [Arvicola amphibius]|uniref:cathepsin R-like isoform X2 n=1 Tax=Arvicola amphibius TaxID=1047088 RepID=UPI0018E3785F|nr:cathepsin R-like isoform X2 [Arvicola amphibius]
MTPVVFLVILFLGVGSRVLPPDPSLDAEWEEWKILYEKSYSQEEPLRRTVWEKNMNMIKLHNGENGLGKNGYTMKMNAFGDMTNEEFRKMMVDFPMQSHERGKSIWKRSLSGLPKFVDWRKEGYVTPVRYQGNCSSCWAFAATGAIEGQMYKKTGKLIPLSVQNLVDCSKPHGNHGCDWGNTYFAFLSVWLSGGLEAEATYPYEGREGPCRYNPQNASAKIESLIELPENEDILMDVVATAGPVTAAIDALHDSFKFYHEGIYYEPNCSRYNLSHAVLVVGYGFDGNETDRNNYWLIKNSWGQSWGMNGYMKIAKDRHNHCGIVSFSQYPLV